MSMTTILLMTLISLLGLAYLAATDPKRRRVFRLPALEGRQWVWLSRVAVFAPGMVFLLEAHWSGFTIWAGAITVLGWLMVVPAPATYARVWEATQASFGGRTGVVLSAAGGRAQPVLDYGLRLSEKWEGRLKSLRPGQTVDTGAAAHIAALETRIAHLESRIEQMEAAQSPLTPTSIKKAPLTRKKSA